MNRKPRGELNELGGMDLSKAHRRVRSLVPAAMVPSVKRCVRTVGTATSARRGWPDFLIVGAKKAGTTSLINWLVQHDGVMRMWPSPQRHKGAHYFDHNYGRDDDWYRGHFATEAARARRERRLGYRPVTGEASPYYLFHPAVPRRVASTVPCVKVIVVLRDPVTRAHSHYWDRVSTGAEPLPTFEAALAAEPQRLHGVDGFDDPSFRHFSFEHHSYRAQGRYAAQIERWFDVLPREQILVVKFERLVQDAHEVFDEVLGFLALPAGGRVDLTPRNERGRSRAMDPATEASLRGYFAPHNERLVELLGKEFIWPDGDTQ